MNVDIRFCTTSAGARIAYTTLGSGPAVVFPAWWINHLELLWEHPSAVTFFSTLARHHTLVLYDRHGAGLSDRDRTDFSAAAELATLTDLIAHLGLTRFALFGFSAGGPTAIAYAAAHPEQVSHLLIFGAGARMGGAISNLAPATSHTRAVVNDLAEANWDVGALALTKWIFPGADPLTIDWLARFLRASATPRMAIELSYLTADVSALLPSLRVPTLVLCRREDNGTLFEGGRQLAACIPHARFVPLEGAAHLFFLGDMQAVLQVAVPFLGSDGAAVRSLAQLEEMRGSRYPDGLTAREVEVLALLAAGLTTREIAAQLVISSATVERHIANVYRKTRARGRAGAATYALRHGLAGVAAR
jgi:pimeloyl-ACP methyl ester carboxylesterase/DNA-binding CsgD family transcriptional regulator